MNAVQQAKAMSLTGFSAALTTMEAALLRGLGLTDPKVDLVRTEPREEWIAVIVRPSGNTIEALGRDPEDATRRVIRMAVSK